VKTTRVPHIQLASEHPSVEAAPSTTTSEFLSRAGHEVRGPLNAILGFGQVLEMRDLGERERADVEQILTAGHHMLDLVSGLLEIWRLDAGCDDVVSEQVDICALVRAAVELTAPLRAARGLALSLELPPTALDCLADPRRTSQALLNVLSNATKYNRDHGSVTVAVTDDGDAIDVRVTDTGVGIAAELMPRLFDPFDRLGAGHTGADGIGLGLPISKRYIERMRGHLGVTSSPGSGTTVTLRLPTADVHASPATTDAAPPRTVLSIEINRTNAMLLEHLLAGRPEVRLLTACDGRTGLDIARSERPDLVLLDLNLANCNGVDVLRELRAGRQTSGVPVVVLCADATPGRAEALICAGAQECLTKPVDVAELVRILDGALEAVAR
jgi:CheY-like chemotaxis protein/anti-sigma regulatory factor (Ser/Thr protein kinase)